MKRTWRTPWLCVLLLSAGCGPFSQQQIDQDVSRLSNRVDKLGGHDNWPSAFTDAKPPADVPSSIPAVVQPVAHFEAKPPPELKPMAEVKPLSRIEVPKELPGATEPPLRLPEKREELPKYIHSQFPPLPAFPAMPPPAPGPEGHPMTLADLQRLALTYSPAVKNARAAVAAAEGAMQQSDAYPNPTLNIEQDTVGTGQAGYQGLGMSQMIKTWGKLKLQKAAAMMDLLNARVALRRAETDVFYQVRGSYFGVLVALETIRVNEALYRFAEDIYRYQVELAAKNVAAAYQAMQVRPLATQARIGVITARNQYTASWRQLAAALGLPDMPPSQIAGRVDQPLPVFDHEKVQAFILENHTDVVTAINAIQKAHYSLELARVTPMPDPTVTWLVQRDYTFVPQGQIVYSAQVGIPVPVWDRNLGAIRQAEAQLKQAAAQLPQSRNALLSTLADAFNRYETNRDTVAIAYEQVRDQVRVYRSLRARYESDPNNVSFGGDLVTAQQTLASYIATYVTALGLQWQAVVDIANLLQRDDLYQTAPTTEPAPVPQLEPFHVPRP